MDPEDLEDISSRLDHLVERDREQLLDELKDERLDPTTCSLEDWLQAHGTRTGTMTINGVTYTDLNELLWRRANNCWRSPEED